MFDWIRKLFSEWICDHDWNEIGSTSDQGIVYPIYECSKCKQVKDTSPYDVWG